LLLALLLDFWCGFRDDKLTRLHAEHVEGFCRIGGSVDGFG
jgi:hypothetical protein